jgi:hypothetical protein
LLTVESGHDLDQTRRSTLVPLAERIAQAFLDLVG